MPALGVHLKRRVLTIRLKNRLLFQFENVWLRIAIRKRWFWSSIMMLKRQYLYQQKSNYDDDGCILARAAHIIRRYVQIQRTPMGNASSYKACDVSAQSKGLNADPRGHYKNRELKKRIILITKHNYSIRAFVKNKCSIRIQQIPNKIWTMVCTF